MTKRDVMIRSGAAAIAVLALSSTTALAQDVTADPAVTAPEAPVATEAPPASDAPVDPLAPAPEPEAATEPTANEEASEPAPAPVAKPKRATASASAARPSASAPAAPVAEAAPPAMEAPAIAPPAPAVAEAMTPAAEADAIGPIDEEVGYGLGAAALLALGVGALAVTRRRRRAGEAEDEAEFGHAEPELAAHVNTRPEPVMAPRHDPPLIAPATFGGFTGALPAFAWGKAGTTALPQRRRETHVERAMRGPTPDNPSLSIRKRLKRAAFFDKREREIAQGKAKPVDRFAGLPKAHAANAPAPAASAWVPHRELEPA